MSKTGEFIGALAANFIVAGIVAKLQGAGAAAVSFTIGLALLAVYFLFFRKKNETASSQPIHIENKPNISPNISPNVSPTFSQTFNPTIKVEFPTATAPAPAALPESRPKLTFDKWDTIAEMLDLWQSGFRITNHGEVAIDVRVKRFEVAPGQFATSGTLTAISARSKAFIPVWLEQYADVPHSREKWDLLSAMKSAFDAGREAEEHVVTITIRYKDFDENQYESAAALRYVKSRNELVFDSTRQTSLLRKEQELIRQENVVFGYMKGVKRSIRNHLRNDVAIATDLTQEEAGGALERLFHKRLILRSTLDAPGGFVYWLDAD